MKLAEKDLKDGDLIQICDALFRVSIYVPLVCEVCEAEMLVMVGGKERTEAEYGALLQRAGFRLERIIPTPTPFKIVESVPA